MNKVMIGSGIAAGAVGTIAALLNRRAARNTSAFKKAGKMLVVGVLGRGMILNLVSRLVKKTVKLQMCNLRYALTRKNGMQNILHLFGSKRRETIAEAAG